MTATADPKRNLLLQIAHTENRAVLEALAGGCRTTEQLVQHLGPGWEIRSLRVRLRFLAEAGLVSSTRIMSPARGRPKLLWRIEGLPLAELAAYFWGLTPSATQAAA